MKNKILQYKDLAIIEAGENNEKLVSLDILFPEIICEYQKKDMLRYVGDEIYVRQSIFDMLEKASNKLAKINLEYRLKIVYGYRHPEIQQAYFDKRKKEIKFQEPNSSEKKLNEKTHLFVAALDVAGHIVGGAVDITITSSDGDLDMGTLIADFSDEEKIKTFCKNITKEQKINRMLLHDLMLEFGFAPFYGEWWHFSYGDKEWAAFYKYPKSLYAPIKFRK